SLVRPALPDQEAAIPLDQCRNNGGHDLDTRTILKHGSRMHSARLLDHFQNPRNAGELPPPAITVEVSNPVCGDILRLSVKFGADRAVEARYKTRGCTASIAAGSALTEWTTGKTRQELSRVKPADIESAVGGLSAESKHAAVLCVDAVRAILAAPCTIAKCND
ncbi:MAG: iron-sulfur cluster assembly scaffold protein, partial [Acidobacteriota bacterium]|nr:iron-sulfur cluster assembly scaffold protein [Acidobacteriota bacterium]